MTILLFVGLVLAIARTTRLLVVDEWPPVKRLRGWIDATFWRGEHEPTAATRWLRFWRGVGHAFAYVWTCPWCMSVWVGFAIWGLADWRLSVPYPWLIVASGSLVAGWLGNLDAEHDQRWELRQRDIEQGRR
jgi:hypothetical protein